MVEMPLHQTKPVYESNRTVQAFTKDYYWLFVTTQLYTNCLYLIGILDK